jgi:hypothetical protein
MLIRVMPTPKIGLWPSGNSNGTSLDPREAPSTAPTSEKTPARNPVRAPRSATMNTKSVMNRSMVVIRQILPSCFLERLLARNVFRNV